MDDRLWNLLSDANCSCVGELRRHFETPWHLACGVDSASDAADLVKQLCPNALGTSVQRDGARIWEWIAGSSNLLQRVQRRLLAKSTRIEAPSSAHVSPGSVYDQLVSGSVQLCKQSSRAHAKWLSGEAGNPSDAEKASRKFWGTVLAQIMFEAKLPICELPAENEEQKVLYVLRALGTRRSKTLRNRARSWRRARDWFLSVKGYPFPRCSLDAVDYLVFLEQEVGTKSCVSEFMGALSVIEDAGQVPIARQLCKDRLVVAASKSCSAEVAEGNTGVMQAKPLTIAMIISMEIFVTVRQNPLYARCLIWSCLLCVWACMRVSDLQGIDVSRLRLFRDGLKGFLVKTKTTGHDKKVAEVPFFVGRDVGLSGRDWLRAGFDLWMGLGQKDRCFLVYQSTEDFEEPIFKFAKPEVISNYMRILWQRLEVPFRKLNEQRWSLRPDSYLLGDECYLFWSGHSMRHVLPTIAAVFGVPKERRDYLGRWHIGLHQSADYIHTCRQIVHDIQRLVCDKLSGGKPGYDEEELLTQLSSWLSKRGLTPEPLVRLHRIMRTVQGCQVLNQQWPLLGDFDDGMDNSGSSMPASNSASEGESPFWISISRHSGHRRLHIRGGCWVTPGSCHQFAEVWQVDESTADSFCRLCYKDRRQDSSSSSGESSSTDLGEAS